MPGTSAKIELDKAFIEKISSNIILVTTKDNSVIDVSDIQEMKKINLELVKDAKYGVISDTGKYSSVSEAAKKYMVTRGMEKNKISQAFIIYSLSMRMIVSHFINFNKPSVPTKIFSNIEDAKVWTEKMLAKQN